MVPKKLSDIHQQFNNIQGLNELPSALELMFARDTFSKLTVVLDNILGASLKGCLILQTPNSSFPTSLLVSNSWGRRALCIIPFLYGESTSVLSRSTLAKFAIGE